LWKIVVAAFTTHYSFREVAQRQNVVETRTPKLGGACAQTNILSWRAMFVS